MTTVSTPAAARDARAAPPEAGTAASGDPFLVLKGLTGLGRLAGMYPAGHPIVAQKLAELDDGVRRHLSSQPNLQMEIIHGVVHLNGSAYQADSPTTAQMIEELDNLGVQSIHIDQGVEREELYAVAEFLWQLKDHRSGETYGEQLARRDVRRISLGRIVPLDTQWRTDQWPDAPTGPMDPSYVTSLTVAQEIFETVAAGRTLDVATVHSLVALLVKNVARSNAALAQVLAVKQYENLTYCHSVNVSMISLLLGRRLGLDAPARAALVEAGVLHDIGKTRVPVDIVKKPAALDARERKLIEAHTIYGAEILVETDGVKPLTATVALEHHRGIKGGGYPDVGHDAVPHLLSQIVSVADVYEAVTGARSYQPPRPPEQACLILARLAGQKFNSAVVRAFISEVTFFPIGSLVRTSRGETGVVVRTNPADPLHPVVRLVDQLGEPRHLVDTSTRDESGAYGQHILETLKPEDGKIDLARFLPAEPIIDLSEDLARID